MDLVRNCRVIYQSDLLECISLNTAAIRRAAPKSSYIDDVQEKDATDTEELQLVNIESSSIWDILCVNNEVYNSIFCLRQAQRASRVSQKQSVLVVRPVARSMKQLLRLIKIRTRSLIMQEMSQTGDDSIFVGC